LLLEERVDVEKSEGVVFEFDVVTLVSCKNDSVDLGAVLLEGLDLFSGGWETVKNEFASRFVTREDNWLQKFDVNVQTDSLVGGFGVEDSVTEGGSAIAFLSKEFSDIEGEKALLLDESVVNSISCGVRCSAASTANVDNSGFNEATNVLQSLAEISFRVNDVS
jgi:hypothetical protein